MPTPAPGNPISFAQVNTEFNRTTPSPMNNKYRFLPGGYTPATPVISTTPNTLFPMDILHGRTNTSILQTFTTPGSWTSTITGNIRVLVVAGGGGGGYSGPNGPPGIGAGGGGAGGVVYCISYPVVNGVSYPYTVGAAGTGVTSAAINPPAANGEPSVFSPSTSSITAIGGGQGGSYVTPGSITPGGTGGSGGGGAANNPALAGPGIQPTQPQPPNCTGYGNNGGYGAQFLNGGGGGGAGAVGTPSTLTVAGRGADGINLSITGNPVYYGAGGGGGGYRMPGAISGGSGGLGGGGQGGGSTSITSPGSGHGAGGGGGSARGPLGNMNGGNGYPGCVIIAYP